VSALIFVYNADDGVIAALFDAAHKLVSPGTYACSLCAVTYGAVSMRRAWKDYLAALPLQKRFYHRQSFARAYPALAGLALPAVLIDHGAGPEPLIPAAELDALPDLAALIALLDARLARA